MEIQNKNIIDIILEIKEGNEILRNDFIQSYFSFIISTISKVTKRYVDVNNSDELSIGLLAFNEAIDKYENRKGSFISFAELVIRSRILDYIKKQSKDRSIPCEDNMIEENACIDNNLSNIEIREEIENYKESLKLYGISLKEVVDKAPKHTDTRENAARIAQSIFENPLLFSEFERKKKIPIKAAAKYCDVSEKVIKSNKIYIMAQILLLKSNGDGLKEYIGIKGGVKSGI